MEHITIYRKKNAVNVKKLVDFSAVVCLHFKAGSLTRLMMEARLSKTFAN